MINLISQLVKKVKDADVVLLGENHSITPHTFLMCQSLEPLKSVGFNCVFLELDEHYQNGLSYVADLPINTSNYGKAFADKQMDNRLWDALDIYLDHRSEPDAHKELMLHKTSGNFNFCTSMVGNKVAYQQMIRIASRTMQDIFAIDYKVELHNIDAISPEGMNMRNEFMAKQIAHKTKTGHKGIGIFGGDHLQTYRQDNKYVPSLQSILFDKYNIKAEAVLMTDYAVNLPPCTKKSRADLFFPNTKKLFLKNQPTLLTSNNRSLRFAKHLAILPEKDILQSSNFSKEYSSTYDDDFSIERDEWNFLCRKNNCPGFAI